MKAAIFDVDGTLLDSMSVWEDIGERYLASQNITAENPTEIGRAHEPPG